MFLTSREHAVSFPALVFLNHKDAEEYFYSLAREQKNSPPCPLRPVVQKLLSGDRLRIIVPLLFVHLPLCFSSTFSGRDGAFEERFQIAVELRRSHRATSVRPLAQHRDLEGIVFLQPGRPLGDQSFPGALGATVCHRLRALPVDRPRKQEVGEDK